MNNGEGEWSETLKNTAVRHAYIRFVQNYPFFQQREIPIGLNPDAICHQMSITPHQKDIDAVSVSLESQILVGFVLKAEQKEAVESLLRGKDVFGVLPTGFRKSLIFELLVLAKNRASSSPNASVEG